ncbi:MAG: hypothetical protein GYB67_03665 [Chloroflexi bacterium]|nr:hypothetical protein [Chloroflexota bacterium]
MIKQIRSIGLNSTTVYFASYASVALSIAIWFLRRGDDRANAERFGIFVGLWAPTLMTLAKVIEDAEREEGGSQTNPVETA